MALLRSMEVPAGLAPILLPGERLVTAVRAHWAKLAEPVATATLALSAAVWVDSNVTKSTQAVGTIFWWLFFALLVRLLWRLLDWSHNWFVATDKRLLLRYGLISHKVAMMPLLKVTDMSYVRSIPGQFLGYGKFVLESAGQDQALREVKWVPNPDQTYRDICAEIFHIVPPPARRRPRGDRRRAPRGPTATRRSHRDSAPDRARWEHGIPRRAPHPRSHPGPPRLLLPGRADPASGRPARDRLRERRPQASPARRRHRPDLAALRRLTRVLPRRCAGTGTRSRSAPR